MHARLALVRRGVAPVVAALVTFTPCTSIARAQGARPLADSTMRAIDALFADHAAATSPGCAVGVYRDGAVVFAKGYGMANLTFGIPIAANTRFTVGSISKQFTAASIALLVRAGRLSLDDDVRTFVPELPDYGAPLRVRQLVHHTSGLRDFWALVDLAGWRFDDGYTTRDMLSLAAAQRALDNVPGAAYHYSNTGYLVLGEIVRRVTGQSLRAFADSAIFRPLGMHDSFFLDDHNEVVPRRATAYSPTQGGWAVNVWNNDLVGQGGLVTTLADLQKWDENFYSGTLGGAPLLALQRTTEPLSNGVPNDYAFGITLGSYRAQPLEEHTGATGGYRAALFRFPGVHTTVTLLCNASDVRNEVLPVRVADLVIGAQLGPSAAAPAPAPADRAAPGLGQPAETARRAGRYASAELLGAVWEIAPGPSAGQLVVRRARGDPLTLTAAGPGTFVAVGGGPTLLFHDASATTAAGFTVTQGAIAGIRFSRVAPR